MCTFGGHSVWTVPTCKEHGNNNNLMKEAKMNCYVSLTSSAAPISIFSQCITSCVLNKKKSPKYETLILKKSKLRLIISQMTIHWTFNLEDW